ncbi:RagB/SusD family nutrient uptake outer membrane protein [Bacteroides sp.]
MKKILTYMLAASFTFAACEIERIPNGSMLKEDITSNPEDLLSSTLNGCYAKLKDWSDVMHRCGEYAGDNIMIRGTSSDAFYEFISYSRTPNNYRLQTFWDNSYKIIAQSSNIMQMIEEGKSESLDTQLGECYFLRGMMYFYLCRAYGRPYYDNPDKNLGVPIVNGTPDDLFNLSFPDRSTVKDTYRQAINDLRKAEKMITEERGPAYASKEAAQALLSRVYLYMSDTYQNPNTEYADSAAYYATQVIESENYSLLPHDKFMQYNTLTPENNDESIFVVKRVASEFSGYDHYYGIGGMYSNIGGMGWGEMYASYKYLQLLDETGRNDWANNKIVDARASFIEPQYDDANEGGYKQLVFRFVRDLYNADNVQTGFAYVQDTVNYDKKTGKLVYEADGKSLKCWEYVNKVKKEYILTAIDENQKTFEITYADGKKYTGVIDYTMQLNQGYPMFYIVKCSREGEDSQLHSPIISRLGEMYLNRAEAYAKLGKYAEAKNDLNKIRERSLPGEGYSSLDASNAAERIDKERQLELAFQAERSYDVYRNGDALERKYPGPHNAMEIVKPTDYRVIYFIPQNAINAYPGTLTQNPTNN